MNNESISNSIAFYITVIFMFVYAIAAFMGMLYLFNGNYFVAVPVLVAGATLLFGCVWEMSRSKTSRNKRRDLPREIVAAVGAIALLVAASWPATLFLYAYEHEDELDTLITDTRDYALGVDSLYQQYADARVTAYDLSLWKMVDKDPTLNKAEHKRRVESLRRRLTYSCVDSISNGRQQWLATLPRANALNPATARNLHDVFEAAKIWIHEYYDASEMMYQGEDYNPFECSEQTVSAQAAYYRFTTLRQPSKASLAAATFCIGCIFLTYFHARRPKSRVNIRH